MDVKELLSKPHEELTEEEKEYLNKFFKTTIDAAKLAWERIKSAFRAASEAEWKKVLIIMARRKNGHKNALVAYKSPIQVKRKRKRAMIRQLNKRYHKAIREVWHEDWESAMYLSIELNDKVLKVNR